MAEKVNITLYSKPGCHLCEDAKEILIILSDIVHFDFEMIDITTDNLLNKKYQYDIPVVLINGEEIARNRMDREKWSKIIKTIKKLKGDRK